MQTKKNQDINLVISKMNPNNTNIDNIYPDFTCMECGKICSIYEEVKTEDEDSPNGKELWCYCKDCEIDTFHKPIRQQDQYGNILWELQK